MRRFVLSGGLAGLLLASSIGCNLTVNADNADLTNLGAIREAIAVMHPTEGSQTRGVVRFTQSGGKVYVVADIEGLTPNQQHAIHVHEWGDVSGADGKATGGHYNPEMHDHGLPETEHRHAGDLGNLQADGNGRAQYEITVMNMSIAAGPNPILGRGVIIHAKADDGGQPTGNAGARIAQGVVGVLKPGS